MRPFWGATVIDGYEGLEGNGPLNGDPVASRLAIASTDLVAADRVGVETMGVNPEWMGYLRYCAQAGLGQFDLERIELRGGVAIDSRAAQVQAAPAHRQATGVDGPAGPRAGALSAGGYRR